MLPADEERVERLGHIHVDPQRNGDDGGEQYHKPKQGFNPRSARALQSSHDAAQHHAHHEQQLRTGIYLLLACTYDA